MVILSGDISKVTKKLLSSGEAFERNLELCVLCPLNGKKISAVGNCFDAKVSDDETSVDSNEDNIVKLHGRPRDFSYELEQKCEYVLNFSRVMLTRDLKGVICRYKPKS